MDRWNGQTQSLSEWQVYADHREALDATLFPDSGPRLVFELANGVLAPSEATDP